MYVLTNKRYYNISYVTWIIPKGLDLGGQKFNFFKCGYHGHVAYQIEGDSEQVSRTGIQVKFPS